MSIKTKHANEIFDRTKKYEYRRRTIGEKNLNKKIYIYSSEEDKKIIGYIIVDKILKGNLEYILKETNCKNVKEIKKYFKDLENCYALHIKQTHRFQEPIELKEIRKYHKDFTIPQFYRYLKKEETIYEKLENRIVF